MRTSDEVRRNARNIISLLAFMVVAAVMMTAASASAAPGLLSPGKPLGGGTPTPTSTPPSCALGWYNVSIPSPGTLYNELSGVTAIAPNDVWAAGYKTSTPGVPQSLILHWDGNAWYIVPSPSPSNFVVLQGIGAVGPNDVWAVGYSQDEPLALHWDGLNWSIVATPFPASPASLSSVSALASNDVWAVGVSAGHTLTIHWNGTQWSVVPSPTLSDVYGYVSVKAIAPNNVWAAGYTTTPQNTTLVMHWDGSQWTVVDSFRSLVGALSSVSASSASDIWVAGESSGYPLLYHWDGSSWSPVTVPDPGGTTRGFSAVRSVGPGDTWAIGSRQSGTGPQYAFSMRCNPSGCTTVPMQNPDVNYNKLQALTSLSANDMWAVGLKGSGARQTFSEHYYDPCPPPTGTPPTGTPTNTPTITPTATATPSCLSGWSTVPSPNNGSNNNYLNKMAVIAPNDVWAVGNYLDGSNVSRTLTEHWDGTAWTIVPSPNNGTNNNYLRNVAAVGPNDVWAVGFYWNSSNLQKGLTEHWDGTAWSLVTTPNGGSGENYVYGLAALSANNVWAIGEYSVAFGQYSVFALHWDGTQWNVVFVPNGPSNVNYLEALAAIAPNDIWTAGRYYNGSAYRTLIEHWNGTNWSVIISPNFPSGNNELRDIAAVSATDVWTVGSYSDTSGAVHTLIQHWDGTQWSIVSSPSPGLLTNNLYGVSVLATDDIWAVGSYTSGTQPQTLIEHWDGTSWSAVYSPNPGQLGSSLNGIAASSVNDVWAVGNSVASGSVARSLVERYTGPCATPTSTPTSTNTPTITPTPTITSTPTRTDTPTSTPTRTHTATNTPTITPTATNTPTGTITPTASATSCPVQFTDVPVGSTFYIYVRCLACRGIVSGYGDNTFRPNNDVTRGQLSKIVSNAAGFNDPAGAQLFDDVAPGSTFYDFIQRLASRGYMNGYPCGGPGEPCHSGNLPYFRPNNNATRGQISKIVSNAAGFNDPAGAQLFDDVAPGSTFYDFVQRLASRGIMSGYPCGGPGEPCHSGNLPYFRPNNNATRGQTVKIVSNTFYPNCQTPIR